MKASTTFSLLAIATHITAYDTLFAFSPSTSVVEETRSLDELYTAALKEGSTITAWHGGDEPVGRNSLKTVFEAKFPGLTLNLTIDLSKYHDVNIDRQLATGGLYVDTAILQTLHDYPRWKEEGALLNYKPAGFSHVDNAFKDANGAYYGYMVINWSLLANTDKTSNPPTDYADFLKPEFQDKLVLTYPNDDDAVLYQFDQILTQYGFSWFDSLLEQNPLWVRGTATPRTLISQPNSSYVASFTTTTGHANPAPLIHNFPTNGSFTTWPQTAAIFKDAPHPEGAKLLMNFLLSSDFQKNSGMWSVRDDVPAPSGAPELKEVENTNTAEFARWMADRRRVESLRFFFESKIGSAQGLSPLVDAI